jgi:hypothetical protein
MLGSTDEVDRYSLKVVSAVEEETEDAGPIISQPIRACNVRALTQVLTTIESLAFLWWIAVRSVNISY